MVSDLECLISLEDKFLQEEEKKGEKKFLLKEYFYATFITKY